MPQMVAILNGCGGGAAALVSTVEFGRFMHSDAPVDPLGFGATLFGLVIGSLSFWGSLVAFGKLSGFMEKAITSPIQKVLNGAIFLGILVALVWISMGGGG